MDRQEIESRVISAIGDVVDRDDINITPETSITDLQVDSLDIAEIIMNIDDELDAHLPFDEKKWDRFKTVGDIIDYVSGQLIPAEE